MSVNAANMYEKQYDYGDCPIKHGEIRLMILKPNAHHSAEIVVQPRVVSIQEIIGNPQTFKYAAISHSWGSEDESNTVFVDAPHGHGPQAVSVVIDFSTDAAHSLQKMERVDGSIYAPRQRLQSLVSSLSTFKTSEPRDTIYALLDLATETCKLSMSNNLQQPQRIIRRRNPAPESDYSIDLLHLYTKFTKWCIGESHSLDIICRRWALPELEQKLDEQCPELMKLPSWIKTVEESESRPRNGSLGGRKTANSLAGLPGNCCYNASNGHFPNVEFRRDKTPKLVEGSPPDILRAQSQIISDMNLTMTIRGRSIGVVSEVHSMHSGIIPSKVLLSLGHVSSTEPQNVPDAVWRTLVADRDVDGKAVPRWYQRACMGCLSSVTDAEDIDTNAILQRCDPPTDLSAAYLKRLQAVCFNRNYIGCEDANGKNGKLVGIAPLDSKVGDVVCILFGCFVPCVLRPFWDARWRESQP
ncbi:uncharacterized protein CCOS01_09161 [Colletotrichum costaricense]|uniref:Heterokaryon incompatibility domain-containing protein n=1 Tax=Colletotrichum costaricense TaxID=1209916 RepID=A0AAI9YUQ8_9PEZI|nr:uncharacterized protein CCOS01_09161 [Colletotrichum costaricense]KAK1524074.1 hypothetical protein CCOS01_09161 [Colletotrichum costaricense]